MKYYKVVAECGDYHIPAGSPRDAIRFWTAHFYEVGSPTNPPLTVITIGPNGHQSHYEVVCEVSVIERKS